MLKFFVVFTWILICRSSPIEDSVVSVYTTLPTTAGTHLPLDVYTQIANNIAERLTSPLFRFLGFNASTPAPAVSGSKHTWNSIELTEDQDDTTHEVKPIDNGVTKDRDVEELSSEEESKPQKKPEKFTLYSSLVSTYLPPKSKKITSSKNEIGDDVDTFGLDDVAMDDPPSKSREGPLIFVMELFGSVIQLVWGGFMNLFSQSSRPVSR